MKLKTVDKEKRTKPAGEQKTNKTFVAENQKKACTSALSTNWLNKQSVIRSESMTIISNILINLKEYTQHLIDTRKALYWMWNIFQNAKHPIENATMWLGLFLFGRVHETISSVKWKKALQLFVLLLLCYSECIWKDVGHIRFRCFRFFYFYSK